MGEGGSQFGYMKQFLSRVFTRDYLVAVISICKRKERLSSFACFILVFALLAAAGFFSGRFFGTSRQNTSMSMSGSAQSAIQLADGSHDDALLYAIKQEGVSVLMTRIVQESGGGSLTDCHQQAHRIGRLGYQASGEAAFQGCNASCHSGCYHGAMESFLHEKGTVNLAGDIDRLCSTFSTSFGIFECLHGVGHGVLALVNYDLPEAIRECDKLSNGFAQSSCYGGLFMENIIAAQGLGASLAGHETAWVNRMDPYFPCNGIEQSQALQHECWMMQTSWMLTLFSYDFKKVAVLCADAPAEWRSVCFASYGRDAAGHTLRDPQKILELCAHASYVNGYYERCVAGAVNVIVDFWGPALAGQAAELCAMVTEKAAKGACYQTLAARIPGLYDDAEYRTKACLLIEEPYRSLCAI